MHAVAATGSHPGDLPDGRKQVEGSGNLRDARPFEQYRHLVIAHAEGEEVRPEIGKPAARKNLDHKTVERLLGQGV